MGHTTFNFSGEFSTFNFDVNQYSISNSVYTVVNTVEIDTKSKELINPVRFI